MFEDLVLYLQTNPYLGVALVFVLCGLGLPLPEEVALVAAGYICFLAKLPDSAIQANLFVMMGVCGAAILAGDIIPFFLGKAFGPRLLRLRFLRYIVTRDRLATFDRWFRRRGDRVIFFARFVPGLRVVAFFTGGTMQMRWRRFLLLDGAGILLVSPLFVWCGYHFGDVIETVLQRIMQIEQGLVYVAIGAAVLGGGYWWWRRSRRRRAMQQGPNEAYVEPTRIEELPSREAPSDADATSGDAGADPSPGHKADDSDPGSLLKGPGSDREDTGTDGKSSK